MTQGYTKAIPLDTDANLTANSDQLAASQKAVKTYIGNKAVEVVTHAATSKTTPDDNDELPLVDSAASYVLKKLIFSNLKIAIGKYLMPVGFIYWSSDSTDPATIFGFGTWTAEAVGRVLVGIDGTQTEFDVNGETGGSKTHTHTIPNHQYVEYTVGGSYKTVPSPVHSDTNTASSLMPYIVRYCWRRTA